MGFLEKSDADNVWRFWNPANVTGTVPGFTVDTSTSVQATKEFNAFHKYYWTHNQSSYVKGPVVMHRNMGVDGIVSLYGCTLRRSCPQLSDRNKEILQIVTSKSEWFELVRNMFFLPLDDLSEAEKERLWLQVS